MKIVIYLPFLISAAFLIVPPLVSRPRSATPPGCVEFRISKWLGILVLVGLTAIACWMNTINWPRTSTTLPGWLIIIGLDICAVTAYIYTKYYSLRLFDDHFTYGCLKVFSVDYRDVVFADIESFGRGGPTFIIRTRTGKVKVFGYIDNFYEAVKLLQGKLRPV